MQALAPWLKSPWILLGVAIAIGFGLTQFAGGPSPVAEAEAYFLKGTYATDSGCKMLERVDKDGVSPPQGAERPITIDREAMRGPEWSCEYARVDRVATRKTYIVTMFCQNAERSFVDHMSMIVSARDALLTQRTNEAQPTRYRRCKIKN
ncbi:MAG: hypothetical protein AAGJ70_05570 [Pseudomonadota bacterium]